MSLFSRVVACCLDEVWPSKVEAYVDSAEIMAVIDAFLFYTDGFSPAVIFASLLAMI